MVGYFGKDISHSFVPSRESCNHSLLWPLAIGARRKHFQFAYCNPSPKRPSFCWRICRRNALLLWINLNWVLVVFFFCFCFLHCFTKCAIECYRKAHILFCQTHPVEFFLCQDLAEFVVGCCHFRILIWPIWGFVCLLFHKNCQE